MPNRFWPWPSRECCKRQKGCRWTVTVELQAHCRYCSENQTKWQVDDPRIGLCRIWGIKDHKSMETQDVAARSFGPCALVAGFSKETRNTVTDNGLLRRHAKTVAETCSPFWVAGNEMQSTRLPQWMPHVPTSATLDVESLSSSSWLFLCSSCIVTQMFQTILKMSQDVPAETSSQ